MNYHSLIGVEGSPLKEIEQQDINWVNKKLSLIPSILRYSEKNKYKNVLTSKGYKVANRVLRQNIDSLVARLSAITIKKPLNWKATLHKHKTEKAAVTLARMCSQIILEWSEVQAPTYEDKLELIYNKLAEQIAKNHVKPSYYTVKDKLPEHYEIALLELSCDQWWRRKLLTLRKQALEALQIALGAVKQGKGNYCSDNGLKEYREAQAKNREFLNEFELENEDGDIVDLLNAFMSGVANPKHRRTELMVRMRGLEELANEQGRIGLFFTLTAPSKFHRTKNKGHHLNPKWQGSTPKNTQEYLCNVWAKVRAAWKRAEIDAYGFRVVEPHVDGTPHWHLLLFFSTEQAEQATNIFKKYAIKEDRHELTTVRQGKEIENIKPRFDVETIDPSKGSATGYIAKYISKNIAADDIALANEPDFDTDKPVVDSVERVRAWASIWNIRQFQQIGGEPVTVYRELRRLDELEKTNVLEPIRMAADCAKFGEFIKLMRENPIKTHYETQQNQYAKAVKKVKGVIAPLSEPVITRVHEWTRQRKDDTKKESGAFPWTRGNNCTEGGEASEPPKNTGLSKFELALKNAGLDPSAGDLLLAGCRVTAGNGIFKVRNGQLIHMRETNDRKH